MMRKTALILMVATFFLSSCTGYFETDNTPKPTPLVDITPAFTPRLLWNTSVGSDSEATKQRFVLNDHSIYTTSLSGNIAAYDIQQGQRRWQVKTRLPITSGIGASNNYVVVGSRYGDVVAMDAMNGKMLWRRNLNAEVIAPPSIANGIAIIKTTNGQVTALATEDGHKLWSYQQEEPNLILRGASSPLIRGNHAIVGFANGNLVDLSLRNGGLNWQQRIAIPQGAFAIERMVDIDADPVIYQSQLYAATYQGNIARLSLASGQIRWSNEISTYTGMVADSEKVYVTDAKGNVWAFNDGNGERAWRNESLKYRILTAPVIQNNYLVVADAQGYIHWLRKSDGKIMSRQYVKGPVYASPIVRNGVLYTLSDNGYLSATVIGQ